MHGVCVVRTMVEVSVGRVEDEFLEEGIAKWEGARNSLGGVGLLLQRQLEGCGDHCDC